MPEGLIVPDRKKPIKPKNHSHNRLKEFMDHSARYSFMGMERLAVDIGIAYITLKRIRSGKRKPSLVTAQRIARLFSEDLAVSISTDEIFSEMGTYPTENVCTIIGCSGCSLKIKSASNLPIQSQT